MSTQPPPSPPVELDDKAKELLTIARHAKSMALDAIDKYEQAVWAAAWDRGYQQGWADGHNYANWQLEQARAQVFTPTMTQTPPRNEPPTPPTLDDAEEGPTAAEIVTAIIAGKPGLRGVEIVAEAEKAKTPVKERTVRTALHRLKAAEKIVNVAERWYLPGAAPRNAEGDLY